MMIENFNFTSQGETHKAQILEKWITKDEDSEERYGFIKAQINGNIYDFTVNDCEMLCDCDLCKVSTQMASEKDFFDDFDLDQRGRNELKEGLNRILHM